MNNFKLFFSICVLLLVAACGGGGGGGGGASGPVSSVNTFDIRAGHARLAASGFSTSLTVSGTCSGTFVLTSGPATTNTVFEGAAALSRSSVASLTVANCTPASSVGTTTSYFDSNYIPLGFAIVGGDYGVWSAAPTLPTAAKVGDVAVVGTINKYTNNTKSTYAGKQENSYVIEADTATTAIANLISKTYNASNVLTSTEQDRYRVAADGSLTLISIDIQYANGSTTHLVMN
jgi:hypothetical protein